MFHYFLLLYPLCGYSTYYLSIRHSMNIWVVSTKSGFSHRGNVYLALVANFLAFTTKAGLRDACAWQRKRRETMKRKHNKAVRRER